MNYENIGSGKLSLFHAFDSVYLRLEVYGWPEGEPNEVKWFEAKKGCKSCDDESLLVSAELAEKLESEFNFVTAKKALQAVRKYQKDWQDHGINRVYLYYDIGGSDD